MRSENQGHESLTENLHVRELTPLLSPEEVKALHPASDASIATVTASRMAIHSTLENPSLQNKLLVISGPCSVHDPEAALEYASWLMEKRAVYSDELDILMRVYFEKPRTTVGWKGLINDPGLDETYDINRGLSVARKLVSDITDMGVPVGTELLDTMTPQYFAGLISWGAIGARTTESQLHRELASGLSFPVGFKNATSGDVQVAIDAVKAASMPHHFLAITNDGKAAIATTSGNPDCHIVLRGGKSGPNYNETSIASTISQLQKTDLRPRLMVDASHANSGKDYTKQIEVVRNVSGQISRGNIAVMGIMIESNLKEGAQSFNPGQQHEYGVSITDACVNLNETSEMLGFLADAVHARRS